MEMASNRTSLEERNAKLDLVKQIDELRKKETLKVKEACKRLGLSASQYNYYKFTVGKTVGSKTIEKKAKTALAKVNSKVQHQTIIYSDSQDLHHKDGTPKSDKVIFFMGSSSSVESLKEILTTLVNRS